LRQLALVQLLPGYCRQLQHLLAGRVARGCRFQRQTHRASRIERLDDGPFGMGSQVRITQPKLPVLAWQVVEFEPGASFAWQATSRGVTTLASHRVAETAAGQSTVTLAINQTGPLASLAGLALGWLTRRYVDMEAEGLKRFCESGT